MMRRVNPGIPAMLPITALLLAAPGAAIGALLAFLLSWNNLPLSVFTSGAVHRKNNRPERGGCEVRIVDWAHE